MKGAFIVLCIALALCLLNYAVDLAFYLKDRFCRYHIGRWKKDAWKTAAEERAIRWLRRTPVVKITDNSRYMLLDLLQGKYKSRTIQSWQKASLILGLLESGREDLRRTAQVYAAELTDGEGDWKQKPTRVDCGMLSFALLRAAEEPARIRKAMDFSAELIRTSINDGGTISYTGDRDDPDTYVDSIGLCCPFLCLYAKTYSRPEFEQLAFRQIERFHASGLLKGTALPNHAFDWKTELPLGVFGWGRGIGWYVLGLLDSYLNMENEGFKAKLRSWIEEAAGEYLRFQREDGGFGSIVQSGKTYDSSATAVLAWFYSCCGDLFSHPAYLDTAHKCLQKLLKCTRINGAIDWCQGDTKGIGVFSQTYDVMPFAQGMCLRAIYSLEGK